MRKGIDNMVNFFEWLEVNGIEKPEGTEIPMTWFSEHGLPMVVQCSCCQMTMALPSAFVDEEGSVFCKNCASSLEDASLL